MHRLIQMVQAAAEFFEDAVCGLGPDERLGVIVELFDGAVDGGLEINDGAEGGPPEALSGEGGEEALDRAVSEQTDLSRQSTFRSVCG